MGSSKYTEEEKRQRHINMVKKWQSTPHGRANHLLNSYKQSDRKANRGEGDLSTQWIVENIFSKPCAHCGKEGWNVIGCNRIDNDKPHTMDNVEPCCFDCNRKHKPKHKTRGKYYEELYQYTLDGELVGVHKGYVWSKQPL